MELSCYFGLLTAVVTIGTGTQVCKDPTFEVKGSGYCYELVEKQKAQQSVALSKCVEKGGSLAEITTSDINSGLVDKLSYMVLYYWIGATDRQREGNWRWLSGRPLVFKAWGGQEPNGKTEENCAVLTKLSRWKDYPCYKIFGFICQYDVNECHTKTDTCDSRAVCTNTPGSYTCSCKPGFIGDGYKCSEVTTKRMITSTTINKASTPTTTLTTTTTTPTTTTTTPTTTTPTTTTTTPTTTTPTTTTTTPTTTTTTPTTTTTAPKINTPSPAGESTIMATHALRHTTRQITFSPYDTTSTPILKQSSTSARKPFRSSLSPHITSTVILNHNTKLMTLTTTNEQQGVTQSTKHTETYTRQQIYKQTTDEYETKDPFLSPTTTAETNLLAAQRERQHEAERKRRQQGAL
ncbi:cell wall protein DAN4 [Lingula anatina]|uniref:Cell wall protein DAN4 n=1 Tax=Lingula anatina TaxID=7574 RepID=A0A1S3K666_LINAN|nr:cell wall protein DAN4 [Lingula anatina]|eukprot:XP_013417924.1 cell wall protein DAN4 [Lingula anatina]